MVDIVKIVAREINVEYTDLIGPGRDIRLVYGRYFVIKYLADHLKQDNFTIAGLIHRDRTTVIASRYIIDDLMRFNREFRKQYVMIETILLKSF